MKTSGTRKLALCLMAFSLILAVAAPNTMAFEVLAKQFVVEEEVTEDDFIKTADNFIILYDSSSSMNRNYLDTGKTRLQVAEEILEQRVAALPELDWNAGLYTYTPSGKTFSKSVLTPYYEMKPFNKAAFVQAVDSLPDRGVGPTPLQKGLVQLDDVLKGLTGKTVVFLFTDGSYTTTGSTGIQETPTQIAQTLASKYNTCFYVISGAENKAQQRVVDSVASINECSRAIAFDTLVNRSEYMAGALYVIDEVVRVEESVMTKVVAVKIKDILFDFDSANISSGYDTELNRLGQFMNSHPDAFVVVAGFTDSTGPEEYNLALSRRRAEAVASYLKSNYSIDESRIVQHWYGAANPKASNATKEGRAMNRRAVIVISGLN